MDQQLFFNQYDLQNKLEHFQKYFNEERAHSSLEMQTPKQMDSGEIISDKVISIDNYHWKLHCRGLYKLPIAA